MPASSTPHSSIFHSAKDVTVSGGIQIAASPGSTVNYHNGSLPALSSARMKLSSAAARTALHDSATRFDAPRCYRNTRAKHLDNLERWTLGTQYQGKHVIWLNGGAGAGKSAIMQSIIERSAHRHVVLGSFFFSRSDSTRNTAEVLIPTLADQIVCAFPEAMTVLEPVINRNPRIFEASLRTQAYELLLRPLRYLVDTGVIKDADVFRGVFVIDGLDECSGPQKQGLIIKVISSIVCEYRVPIYFLISSRPELAISSAFQREHSVHGTLASITLNDDDDARSDIRQFIEDNFLDILDSHPLNHHISLPWPDPQSVDKLVRTSSGHFIYAATAMKYISAHDEHPPRALRVVEGLQPSRTGSPFAELDALYFHILSSAKYKSQVLRILRHCIFSRHDNSDTAVCCMFNISPEDVALFLSDVQALVYLSPNHMAAMSIMLKHASFTDFLVDEKRSHAIYMSKEDYMASCLMRYFQLLDNGPPISSLYHWQGGDHHLIAELAQAIVHSRNTDLLRSLISGHSPQDIWNFCLESFALNTIASSRHIRNIAINSVCLYMRAICRSVANDDNTLYINQFKMYIQLVLDDLSEFIHKQPQYRITPALMFSSSLSELGVAVKLMFYFGRRFQIGGYYVYIFHYLQGSTIGKIDPRSFEAITCSPQSQISWRSDLAVAMKLVLRQLADLSSTPEWLYPNSHHGWLRKIKPLKHTSLGSPKLSYTFYSYLRTLPRHRLDRSHGVTALQRHGCSSGCARKIWTRREKCLVLLKAVIFYMHKSDCTSEVVRLARRSLPRAALWFPKLMKRARAEMDAYVYRWEGSLDSLLEKTYEFSINGMD